MKNKEFLNQELLPLTCKMFNKQLGLVEVSDAKIKSIKKTNFIEIEYSDKFHEIEINNKFINAIDFQFKHNSEDILLN